MICAYADPPYLGCGKLYLKHHPEALKWDDPENHKQLIEDLCEKYECWAYSLTSTTLKTILPFCPDDVRVMAWVKPFAVFKPNVNPGYTWEPVIVRGCRQKRDRTEPTIRDFVSCPIALKKGLVGAKPDGFWLWLFQVFGMKPGDEFVDIFPGTGRGAEMFEIYMRQQKMW